MSEPRDPKTKPGEGSAPPQRPDFEADAREQGLVFHPVGLGARDTLSELADAVLSGGLRMLREMNRYMERSLRAQFSALPEAAAGAQLIVAAGVQMAAASVAERHGAAYRYVAYAPGFVWVGAFFAGLVDAPLSLSFDTTLLPVDALAFYVQSREAQGSGGAPP